MNVLRIFVNKRLEGKRYALDVTLPPSAQFPIRIGSDPSNELKLPGTTMAPLAAALWNQGDQWAIEPYVTGCTLAGSTLIVGRKHRYEFGQSLGVGAYSLELERSAVAPRTTTDRAELENEANEVLVALHRKILPRVPAQLETEDQRLRDEHLLDLEQTLDELSDAELDSRNFELPAYLAGAAIRSELMRRIIRQGQQSGSPLLTNEANWTRMVSAVSELERDVERLLRRVAGLVIGTSRTSIQERIKGIEQRFWDTWEANHTALADVGLVRYLARTHLKREIKDLLFGFGPLEDLLRMPTVTEIMINNYRSIYIEHDGELKNSGRRFISNEVTLAIVERIVGRVGRRIDRSQPMVDARLPDGSRINAIIPPLSVDGPCLTIRRFRKGGISLDEMIARGSLTRSAAEFLVAAVRARQNIVVSGGTGSGKTTLLNGLSQSIPDDERIVTIEDTAELQLQHPHVVRLETRGKNLEGQGAVTIRELLRNALRMRPNRIVVGECRGPEALDMLQAMNTGHDGSLTTVHANAPADLIGRLEVMVMEAAALPVLAIHRQIATALNLVVQLERHGEQRRVCEIAEPVGIDPRTGTLRFRSIFQIDEHSGRLRPTGALPSFIGTLVGQGQLAVNTFYSVDGLNEGAQP